MKMGPVFFLAALPVVVHAQTQASLGVGVGTVRYAGTASFSAATFSPAAQMLSPSFYVGASGALSMLKDGVWAGQGRADFWAAVTRSRGREGRGPQVAVSLGAAASSRSDGVGAGGGYAIGEVMLTVGRIGVAVGAGPVGGVIQDSLPVTAARLRARAWSQAGATQLWLTVEPTRFRRVWYSDLTAGATVDPAGGRIVGSVWVSARINPAYGSKGAASAALQYFVSPTVAVEAAGGSYLNDPFQGLPQAGFLTAGVRVYKAPRSLTPPARTPRPARPVLAPLVADRRGDSVVVRFRMEGARSVAIAGDWNAWQPVPLHALGGDIWESALVLAPGTYHFSLLVDGADWVVPGGVAVVSDGMGGLVAVLTVL
jgi:hypothetical protein